MLNTRKLIQKKTIVCPKTRQELKIKENFLSNSGGESYEFIDNVPFFIDRVIQTKYLEENSASMKKEYTTLPKKRLKKTATIKDYASKDALEAVKLIYPKTSSDVCISIGGGPGRVHKDFYNINIDMFSNVDIVADAYLLPFSNKSVNSVYIGAVIEHLECPEKAVAEIYRVLKPQGNVYSDIPFIQRYHGYPSHFQNFTLTGHIRLFERAGFNIINHGVCVGPTYAMLEIVNEYLILLFGSKVFGKILRKFLFYFGKLIRPLDKKLNKKTNSYLIASTTFVLGEKPRK